MTTGVVVAVAAVALAVVLGVTKVLTDGRFRRTGSHPGSEPRAEVGEAWASVSAAVPDAALGERATLVQFSSAFCAPCRATRRVLTDVASSYDGVVHLEVDAESHLDLVRTLKVLRTPTTVVVDAGGHEVGRASGAPRKDQVLAVLDRL
ncbi:thioredoxin family protein [Nocardioides sp. SYSU D00038]|uniref:thioredoxin family protein n=1 Tax=Nocardioides sp. SYSU D00038 TaxID=2812554 RepID=UPI001967B594|nr:thioredoxin family protein [Nocardioides sp. SYSU D00038]